MQQKRTIRLYSDRLYAQPGNDDDQCAGCFGCGSHSGTGSISAGERSPTADQNNFHGKEKTEPEIADHGDPSDHGGFPNKLCKGYFNDAPCYIRIKDHDF